MKKIVKNNRVEYVDILRSFALLYMIIYHIWVVTNIRFNSNIVNSVISCGGSIGVRIFFIISGFGIYRYLNNKKDIKYIDYLKSRIKRIGPHYYISIIISLLFTSSVVYLGRQHIFNIISHIFFIHNLFISSAGAINGVLWTMGVIFQFYIIAPFIKKMIDKHSILTLIIVIIFSNIAKYITYIILQHNNYDSWYYFNYGIQIYDSIDAFVLGMFISKLDKNKLGMINIIGTIISILLILLLSLVGSNFIPIFGSDSIYSLSFKGLMYFPLLNIAITLLIYFITNINYKKTLVSEFMLFISKFEYSIYIWHLLVLNNLMNNISIVSFIQQSNPILSTCMLLIFLLFIGIIFDLIISNINFNHIFDSLKLLFRKEGR